MAETEVVLREASSLMRKIVGYEQVCERRLSNINNNFDTTSDKREEKLETRKELKYWQSVHRKIERVSEIADIHFDGTEAKRPEYPQKIEVLNTTKIMIYLEKAFSKSGQTMDADLKKLGKIISEEDRNREMGKTKRKIQDIEQSRDELKTQMKEQPRAFFKKPLYYQECMDYIDNILKEVRIPKSTHREFNPDEPVNDVSTITDYAGLLERYQTLKLANRQLEDIEYPFITKRITELQDIQYKRSAISMVKIYLMDLPYKSDYQEIITELRNIDLKLIHQQQKILEELKEKRIITTITKIKIVVDKEEKRLKEKSAIEHAVADLVRNYSKSALIRVQKEHNLTDSQLSQVELAATRIINGKAPQQPIIPTIATQQQEAKEVVSPSMSIEEEALLRAKKNGYIEVDKKLKNLSKLERQILYSYVREIQTENEEKKEARFSSIKQIYDQKVEEERKQTHSSSVGMRR